MTFKEFFDVNILFYPSVYYDGEVILGGELDFGGDATNDYFVLNSKVANKQNLYMQFLEKYFYSKLKGFLNSDSLAHLIFPKICLGSDIEDKQRKTTFSFSCFLSPQLTTLNVDENLQKLKELGDKASLSELVQFLKGVIRKERSIYDDVLTNGKNSKYYEEVFELYNSTYQGKGQSIKFSQFLEMLKDGCTKRIMATRSYESFFSKEIDIDSLVSCFDYDKFCLIGAKSVLDACATTERLSNKVDNSIVYLKSYLDAVDKYRELNPTYDCSIITVDKKTGRKKVITIDDIKKEYQEILTRHPDFKVVLINAEDVSKLLKRYGYDDEFIANFDYSTKDAEVLLQILDKIEAERALLASWKIIPKGARQESESENLNPRQQEKFSLEEHEKTRRMVIGREFLEASDYVFRLEGLNAFEGYIGYIYRNGSVVFEKYYENVDTRRVASGNATYVMNLDNFVEVSKLSKMEIISKLNSGEITGVKRIFHRVNMDRWKSEVTQAITGSDYTIQVEEYIGELLNSKELSKKGVKQ